jgi:hypothetical protein
MMSGLKVSAGFASHRRHNPERRQGRRLSKFVCLLPQSLPASPKAARAFLTTAISRLAHRRGPACYSMHQPLSAAIRTCFRFSYTYVPVEA